MAVFSQPTAVVSQSTVVVLHKVFSKTPTHQRTPMQGTTGRATRWFRGHRPVGQSAVPNDLTPAPPLFSQRATPGHVPPNAQRSRHLRAQQTRPKAHPMASSRCSRLDSRSSLDAPPRLPDRPGAPAGAAPAASSEAWDAVRASMFAVRTTVNAFFHSLWLFGNAFNLLKTHGRESL